MKLAAVLASLVIAGCATALEIDASRLASAVVFLADERQRHVTGIALPASGGALIPMPRD